MSKHKDSTDSISTRFDLEAMIMECWHTQDDLKLIARAVVEDEETDADKTANALVGLAEIHEMRCKQLWDCFEKLVENGLI